MNIIRSDAASLNALCLISRSLGRKEQLLLWRHRQLVNILQRDEIYLQDDISLEANMLSWFNWCFGSTGGTAWYGFDSALTFESQNLGQYRSSDCTAFKSVLRPSWLTHCGTVLLQQSYKSQIWQTDILRWTIDCTFVQLLSCLCV